MSIEVVGHRVMIAPDNFKKQTEWGFDLDVGDQWKREKAATVRGEIVGIGPNAWLAYDTGQPWAKVGDKVYYAKYSGKVVEHNGEEYIIINDDDVQAIIHESEE